MSGTPGPRAVADEERQNRPRLRSRMNNAFEAAGPVSLDPRAREEIERRTDVLGPSYRLFYREPVQVSRGKGVLLYDRDGNEYLDAYNNVVSVGHAHPRVVEEITRQLGTLTTHTRYLQDGILPFAEHLLSTFDGELSDGHTMFTCTGSEANDLAMRIAKHYTGEQGVIVTADAYHGNSELTAGFSPSESSALGAWVRCVPAPDSFRYPASELPQRFTASVLAQIADLEARGEGVAAFIVDSMFTSDGIFVDPVALLAPAVEAVRAAGGLFIADEVQSGFARSGESMWGHRRHDVHADMVTLGKPMGNGFPIGAVVSRREVVAPFGRDVSYFNTFGGNDVAIAAARATLGVVEDEGLLDNARVVGGALADQLRALATTYPVLADVRGSGLYVGLEVVREPGSTVPDSRLTDEIVNQMRRRRVLISSTGPHGNVLKIRPPLVFAQADVDRLCSELEAVMKQLAGTQGP